MYSDLNGEVIPLASLASLDLNVYLLYMLVVKQVANLLTLNKVTKTYSEKCQTFVTRFLSTWHKAGNPRTTKLKEKYTLQLRNCKINSDIILRIHSVNSRLKIFKDIEQ